MLKTNCILAPITGDDWLRVSVMSRHTLNDWKTPDTRLEWQFDIHMPELWPAPKLVGAYYRKEINRDEFKERFIQQLNTEQMKWAIKFLVGYLLENNVTLLCIEEDPTFCHRKLLAQEFSKYSPWLQLDIK